MVCMEQFRLMWVLEGMQIYNIQRKALKPQSMFNEPNWLDLEEELYPTTVMSKVLCVQNYPGAGPIEFPVEVIYNSLHRQIDLTDCLTGLMTQFYSQNSPYQISLFDPFEEDFRVVGNFPFQELIIVKGVYVERQVLYLKIEELDEHGNLLKDKPKRKEKTLRDILQIVAKWRKLQLESKKKITLEEAAGILGVPKSTLDDYYIQIKLAQQYGFNFQTHFEQPFSTVRKFVKEKHEKKAKNSSLGSVMGILKKYQPNEPN